MQITLYGRGVSRLGASARVTGQLISQLASNSRGSSDLDDAVKVSLSSRARSLSKSKAGEIIEEVTSENSGPSSIFGGILKELSTISSELRDLAARKEGLTPGSADQEEYDREITALNNRYKEILSSDNFKRLRDIATQVQSSLQYGTSGEDLYKVLRPEAGFLGYGLLERIRRGELTAISSVNGVLDSLTGLGEGDLSSEGAVDRLDDIIARGYESLLGPQTLAAPKAEQAKKAPISFPEIPELEAHVYGSHNGLSFVVRSYDSDDLIKAAQAHMPLDPSVVISLVNNVDEEEQNRRTDEVRRKKHDERMQSTARIISEEAKKRVQDKNELGDI